MAGREKYTRRLSLHRVRMFVAAERKSEHGKETELKGGNVIKVNYKGHCVNTESWYSTHLDSIIIIVKNSKARHLSTLQ